MPLELLPRPELGHNGTNVAPQPVLEGIGRSRRHRPQQRA
jgi:hypothetical protein